MKNKYYRRSRIEQKTFGQLLLNFAKDRTASRTAYLTKLSVRSVNSIYLKLRQRIAFESDNNWDEIKNSHSDSIKISRRPILRPCQQQGQKILVLLLSQYENQVHLDVVPDARKTKPQALNYQKPIAISAQDKKAEQLWHYLDRRLTIFRGVHEKTFPMHVKETAFRFNHQGDLYHKLLEVLEENPL